MKPEKLLAELIRKGGTLLSEACPSCGGLLVKYKGKVVCPSCSGIKSVEQIKEILPSHEEIDSFILDLAYKRINVLTKELLKNDALDVSKEKILVETILLYYKLIKELKSKGQGISK